MLTDSLLHILALQGMPYIGDITAKKLIQHCGSAMAVFEESTKNLLKIDGIGLHTVAGFKNSSHLKEAEAELSFIETNNINTLYYKDELYPKRLKQCIDGPILLFQTGNINLKNKHIISIVGTRKITSIGSQFCESLVEALKPYNPVIVSGFAYGTDITAHRAAIKQQLQTIACMAHGLNQIYPKVHKKYVEDVEQFGGFLSDFWSSATFDRKNFLKRNRVIAGLSEATIVIESAEKGGSLVTADIANSYNRDVFAVPGRPKDPLSIGCNNLIKSHKAHLLTTPLDIPYILNWTLPNAPSKKSKQTKLLEVLTAEEQMIFDYLKAHPKSLLDSIAIGCNIPTYKVASMLLNMELNGVLKPLPGKCFELV